MKSEQPGTRGVQFDAKTGYLYYISTAQQLPPSVNIEPTTLMPADLPEFIARGREWDDFAIDGPSEVAYVTTHRENTIDCVRLKPDGNREGRPVVPVIRFSTCWSNRRRSPGATCQARRAALVYKLTDGGTAPPPDECIALPRCCGSTCRPAPDLRPITKHN